MIDILLMICNLQNFADSPQGFIVYPSDRPHHQNDVALFILRYIWNFAVAEREVLLEAHSLLEMS